jgi:hypothetical protein
MINKVDIVDAGKMEKGQRSIDYYRAVYRSLDPAEIAARCAIPFDEEASVFTLNVVGAPYHVGFPEFEMRDFSGGLSSKPYESILFMRYLCGGKYAETTGKQLSYHDVPWGEVYYRNFEGRCLKRLAYTFGANIAGFKRIMEGEAGLKAASLNKSDAGYRFEFMTGFYLNFLIWAADEEFPPSAQILFDDNFAIAFTAEDLAVVCETAISRLKSLQAVGL